MKINTDPKLDFDDVLLVPQRSRTASRKEIKLDRKFSFYHSNKQWSGVPIFAANMDTTGTVGMSNTLSKYNISTCLHKHYDKYQYAGIISNYDYGISERLYKRNYSHLMYKNKVMKYLFHEIAFYSKLKHDLNF